MLKSGLNRSEHRAVGMGRDHNPCQVRFGPFVGRRDLKGVVTEVSADYVENARAHWAIIEKKYLVENARTEPMVTMVLNDNWIEFTVRYVVEFKRAD